MHRGARYRAPRLALFLGVFGGMVFVERVRWASRCKDAGSPDSGAIGATEDAAARRSSAAARHNHYFAKPS